MAIDNRYKAFALHLCLSLLILGLLLGIIFFYWYPYDFIKTGGSEGLKILAGVDLVLGPLLTLIIFNPAKKKHLLKLDLSLIAMAQASCMALGLWLIYNERPLVQVLADDGVHVLARSNYEVYHKNINTLDLPGSNPKFAVLDFPTDAGQLRILKFINSVKGSPYELDTSRYRAPGDIDPGELEQIMSFVQANISQKDRAIIATLPREEDCLWLPVKSVHFHGYGCTSTELGIVKLAAR